MLRDESCVVNVVISPHLDDAVLSLGQHLAAEPHAVATVFAGVPRTARVTPYDASCGWNTSVAAVNGRRAEDANALSLLGAMPIHYNFLDNQYGGTLADVIEEWASYILSMRRAFSPEEPRVFVPVGVGHPDHRMVGHAFCAAALTAEELVVYEELPYRVMWPEQIGHALDEWTKMFDLEPFPLRTGPLPMKLHAIALYRSQYPHGPWDPCLSVPERAWRAIKR